MHSFILAELDTEVLLKLAAQWGGKVLLALVTLIIGFYVAKFVGSMLGKQLDRKEVDPTVKPFLCALVSTLIKVAVVVSAIGTLGVEATSFAAIFASIGLAVGMALSGTLQNFAGGVLLLVFRPFKVGDFIETQGYMGSVQQIQIFQTFLTTPDNKLIMVPNGKVANDSMVNFSAMSERRVDFVFGIGYGDDIDQARSVIEGVLAENTSIITGQEGREPMVVVGELADSSVNFTVRVWVKAADYWDVFFSTNEKMKKAFDVAGISIPFPQQDVHVFKQ